MHYCAMNTYVSKTARRAVLFFCLLAAPLVFAALPTSTISANVTSVSTGQSVLFSVAGSDTDGNLRFVNLDQISPNAGWYGEGVTSDDEIPPSANAFNIGSDQYNYTRQVTITFGTTGTFVFKGAVHDSAGSGWQIGPGSVTITVTAGTAPTISTHPASATKNAGFDVGFSVSATGTTPFTYQWRKNGTNISGATAQTLILSNIATSAAGNYSAIVTNSAGNATSNNAALTVNDPDADGNGNSIPDMTDTALGTNASSSTNDTSNTQQQNVHRPN